MSFSVPVSCTSDLDCAEENSCRESICLPTCRADQECAKNEKCIKGNCICKCIGLHLKHYFILFIIFIIYYYFLLILDNSFTMHIFY